MLQSKDNSNNITRPTHESAQGSHGSRGAGAERWTGGAVAPRATGDFPGVTITSRKHCPKYTQSLIFQP